jgi:hypothetical protein
MPRVKKIVKTKRFCVQNQKTKRCIRSVEKNDSSQMCNFFNKSQRCRKSKNNVSFVTFKSYKMKKMVRSYLTKKIVDRPLDKIIASAEKTQSYEDTLQVLFENKRKTPAEIKNNFLDEVLELASNEARDNEGSDIITMKSLKSMIKVNAGFEFLL